MSRGEVVLGQAAAWPATTPAAVVGAPDAARIVAAAHAAGAHAFVAELPEGYATPVGEGGVTLTGAQRLRLRVAAAIVADPAVVVLDDPTGGLDPAGETAALPGLATLLRGREVRVLRASPAVCSVVSGTGVHPARRDVLPADPALPGLARLLDPDEMARLLGRHLGAACADVRIVSTRYKPGDNAVVQYAVSTPAGWVTAVGYARADGAARKATSSRNRRLALRASAAGGPAGALVHLPEVDALLQVLPLDLRLPVLADTAERLAARLAKKGLHVAGAEPELLRYWPRRRAVLRFGPYVLKVYRDTRDYDHARRALRASAALVHVRTPGYAGRLKARQVTVQQWIPGVPPSLPPGSSEPAGAVLAALQREEYAGSRRTLAKRVLAKAGARAGFARHLVPALGADLDALLAELEDRAPHHEELVTGHGNFHAGQLLADPGQGLAVLDFDRMCRASPAYDVASFAAHLAFGRAGDGEVLAAAVDSLVAGLGRRPADLDWYLATCLLRRTQVPFRFQDEHWPETVAGLVALAREVLG